MNGKIGVGNFRVLLFCAEIYDIYDFLESMESLLEYYIDDSEAR